MRVDLSDRELEVVVSTSPIDDLTGLLASARAGDGAAFTAIFRRFAPIVHGVALARIGPAEADDVVQETFLALHRSLKTLRDAAALPGWLRAVAVNASIDRLRRRARAPAGAPRGEREARTIDRGEAELRQHVFARIQELPEAYRETLVWRLVEGLTGPEIAERTGLTPGSVRINLFRGMSMLRERLAKEDWL